MDHLKLLHCIASSIWKRRGGGGGEDEEDDEDKEEDGWPWPTAAGTFRTWITIDGMATWISEHNIF